MKHHALFALLLLALIGVLFLGKSITGFVVAQTEPSPFYFVAGLLVLIAAIALYVVARKH
ncbi:hypothetical protein COV18_05210 [Candidatus Woesearchaeota archaeon CG10_big_fil_rev_8_21_14_0_10_37_12]|nr:MAG: hypothetical protein COV18_05210 [Candidatus Woesearchaeota archaeon CG10_big_fil_rev_8_21_14_0_10_37_12]